MNSHALGYIYGWGLALFSLTIIPSLIIAVTNNETGAIAAFLVTGLAGGFFGGALIIALKGNKLEINRREKILLIISLWVTFCLLASIPFEASDAIKGRLNAIFEATSGLTTTGATLIDQISLLPKSILFWRSQLQWVGGFLTLFTVTYALSRFMGAERVTKEIYKSSSSQNDELLHLQTAFRLIVPVYLGLSVMLLFLLIINKIPAFEAICLTMATISTGGFMPRDGALMTYGSVNVMYILSIFMFLGSVSILWVSYFIKHNWSNLKKFSEPLYVGATILIIALITFVLKIAFDGGREFIGLNREIATALMNASSLISTTGLVANPHSWEHISPALILIFMLIGGGILSTAGGLKFTRVLLMFRQSNRELRSLIYPHEVRPLYLSNEEKDYFFLSTVWVVFGLTIIFVSVIAAIFSFYGMGLEEAYFAATASVSNCGACYQQVIEVHIPDAIPLMELAKPAKLAMLIAMLVGRLEIIIIISLFNISFWRH